MSALRSDIFVAAYVRRRNGENAFAVVASAARRRPAPSSCASIAAMGPSISTVRRRKAPLTAPARPERLFQRLTQGGATAADIESRLAKEMRFDGDLWIVDVEDPSGDPKLDLAS